MSTFEGLNQNRIPPKPTFYQKIKDFWLKYDEKIILAVGVLLIAGISFEAGFLQGEKTRKEPVIVNKIAASTEGAAERLTAGADSNQPTEKPPAQNIIAAETKNCPYVASKNSNKFHLASCQFAAKIKPENKICFSSADEAQKRGFQGAKCCVK